jgi:molybdopterin-guanine dinucleotide biosynthesis protein A
MAPREIAAVVLAGGASRRFGSDKLAALLGGRPLLDYAVLAVAAAARDVVVVGSGGPARLPSVAGVTIRRVPDGSPQTGPLGGLETALGHLGAPFCIVVGGDMPTLVPALLSALVDAIDAADGVEASALLVRGRRQPLPIAVRTGAAERAIARVTAAGETSLQAMLGAMRVREVNETTWRRLDPGGASTRDVDRPADLPR